MPRTLVLVTGTGRSGTSTMSGTLHHLGLHVPGPYLGANESNPKGFYESRWSVRFHNDLCRRAGVHIVDARPEALARVRAAITPADRDALAAFVAERTTGHPQTVVKDPRTTWTQQLWAEVAGAQGLDMAYIGMLRHPAEVAGSRLANYSRAGEHEDDAAAAARQRADAITNVARWINTSLVSEHETRGRRRAFVAYTDLLTDWRSVTAGLADRLGLVFDVDPASGGPSAVDDFIDGGLRRHRVGWDDLDVPVELAELAEAVWQLQLRLRDDAAGPEVGEELDELSARYNALQQTAAALDADARAGAVRVAEQEWSSPQRPLAERRVGDVGGRELLRAVAGRVKRRVRP